MAKCPCSRPFTCPCMAPGDSVNRMYLRMIKEAFTADQVKFWIRVADEFMIRYE
jgi:hypothetical protein